MVRMAGGHGHPAHGARRRRTGRSRRRKVDRARPGGCTAQHGLVAPADALDEDFLRAANPGLVGAKRGTVDDGLEPLEALGDDVAGHELRLHGGRPRPGTWREDERERGSRTRLGADRERVLEVRLGLTGEPDDDVGRHG